jgi:heat-inducible transcriptional repressor
MNENDKESKNPSPKNPTLRADEGMTERRKEILRIIIREFVNTATPVSSEIVVNKYRLPVSTATVRNEMAELEREGYIHHPHVSAGRVPTDKGYRYFVETLMERPGGLTQIEQHTIQHQFYQIQLEINEWLRLAASVTARTAQNAAVVSTPRTYDNRLKRLELIEVQERLVLMVIVTQDGTIREQMLTPDTPLTQEELSSLANRFNTQFVGMTWSQIDEKVRIFYETEDWIKPILNRLIETLRALAQFQDAQIYRDGISNILNQPEFSDVSKLRQVLQTFESGSAFTAIIPEVLSNDVNGVQVIIGGENRFEDMRLLSLVLARYGVDGQVSGVIGIVGPTRMAYDRSISTVQYISQLLSNLVTERSGLI